VIREREKVKEASSKLPRAAEKKSEKQREMNLVKENKEIFFSPPSYFFK
jgi:hypothetical protein